MKRRITYMIAPVLGAALLGIAGLAGCSSPTQGSETPTPTTNNSKVMLVVSFGTSYNDNRDLSIGGVENSLQEAYPDYQVRRAFTSQIIIDKLAKEGTRIDNVQQAMDRLIADGVQEVIIQPTTIMAGYEYMDMVTAITPYKDRFATFGVGSPLLTEESDFNAVAKAITSRTAEYVNDDTAVIFMGHGTTAPSSSVYSKMNDLLKANYKNYFVGALESEPSFEAVLQEAKDAQVKKVVLQPLMIVAGDHANNDMAGDDEDSWKSMFIKEGFEVETLIEGLGQNPEIQKLIIAHAKNAIDTAVTTTPVTGLPIPTPTPVGDELAAWNIENGEYDISALTESSMFKIVEVSLEVGDEEMFATITLSGSGYGRLILGTAENAAKATTGFIEFTSDNEDRHVYVVPVSRLNKPMSIAAESGKNPGTFYDQTVTFLSEKIPAEAIVEE